MGYSLVWMPFEALCIVAEDDFKLKMKTVDRRGKRRTWRSYTRKRAVSSEKFSDIYFLILV